MIVSNKQNVNIIEFSIAGIPGFKTACVTNMPIDKRVYTALNDIAKRLNTYERTSGTITEQQYVDRAIAAIELVRQTYDQGNWQYVNRTEITLEEFYASSESYFEDNLKLFLAKNEVITHLLQSLTQFNLENVNSPSSKGVTNIYQCTGGVLGNLTVAITAYAAVNNPDTAQQTMGNLINQMVDEHRSMLLTDYLRFDDAARKQYIRDKITYLDNLGDQTDHVVIKNVVEDVFNTTDNRLLTNNQKSEIRSITKTMLFHSNYAIRQAIHGSVEFFVPMPDFK